MIFDQIFDEIEVQKCFYQNDFAKAIGHLKDKYELYRGNDLDHCFAYQNKICEFHFLKGEYTEALNQSTQLLAMLNDIPAENLQHRSFLKNWIYQNHATAKYYLGKYDDSIKWANESLQNVNAITPDLEKRFIANGKIILGKARLKKGDLFEARMLFYRALALYIEVFDKNHIAVGQTYSYLGLVSLFSNHIKIAEKYFQKALSVFRKSPLNDNHVYIGLSRNNMAYCNYTKAKLWGTDGKNYLNEAKNYYKRALMIFEQLPYSKAYQAVVYRGMADLYKLEENWEESLRYYDLELVCQETILQQKHHPNISRLYNSKSEIYYQRNELKKAIANAQLAIYANVDGFKEETDLDKNPNISLSNIDSPQELVKAFENKAKALKRLYEVDRSLPNLKKAVDCLTQAVKLILRIGQSFSNNGSKLMLTEQVRPIQELALEYFYQFFQESKLTQNTTERQQLYNDFFKVLQKSKATLLLESIVRKNIKGLNAKSIPDYEMNGNGVGHSVNAQQSAGIDRRILNEDSFAHLLYVLDNDHFHKHNRQVSQLLGYLHKEITIEQLQAEMQEENTAVISYFVGKNSLYSIIITNNDFIVKNLSEAKGFTMDQLKEKVLAFRDILNMDIKKYYDLDSLPKTFSDSYAQRDRNSYGIGATARINRPSKKPTAPAPPQSIQSQLTLNPFSLFSYITTAHFLYENIIESLQLDLETHRIYIIPDEYLAFLPFEALLCSQKAKFVDPNGAAAPKMSSKISNYAELDYLIHRYNISYFFSVATLYFIHAGKNSQIPMQNVSYLGIAANIVVDEFKESAKNFLFEKEINTVHNLFRGRRKKYIGNVVQKEDVLIDFEKFQILHIACHGSDTACLTIIENESPPTAQEMITPKDIQELEINAELIILSACYSGIGPLAHGEGVIALNRSFIHANGKNIIYTLFGVPANSSYELMESFANKITTGTAYSTALWEAKKEFILKKKAYTPKCWAGYVFMGSHESKIITTE